MAIYESLLPALNDTDAHFQNIVAFYTVALAGIGMVQDIYVGQIDPLTVTRPTTTNTFQGGQIWHFNDGNANTTYFKIEYGTGPSTNAFCIRIQFASGGTDGVGGLTGNPSTQGTVGLIGASGASQTFVVSGDNSWFSLGCFAVNTTNAGFAVTAARSKDSSGADSTRGINIVWIAAANIYSIGHSSEFLFRNGTGLKSTCTQWLCAYPRNGTTAGSGTEVSVFCVWPNISNAQLEFDSAVVVGVKSDHGGDTGGNAVEKSYFGVPHQFRAIGYIGGVGSTINQLNGNSAADPTALVRCE